MLQIKKCCRIIKNGINPTIRIIYYIFSMLKYLNTQHHRIIQNSYQITNINYELHVKTPCYWKYKYVTIRYILFILWFFLFCEQNSISFLTVAIFLDLKSFIKFCSVPSFIYVWWWLFLLFYFYFKVLVTFVVHSKPLTLTKFYILLAI